MSGGTGMTDTALKDFVYDCAKVVAGVVLFLFFCEVS